MTVQIGQQLGAYEITSLLGKGGMGEVFRARDSRLGRDVAIHLAGNPGISAPAGWAKSIKRATHVWAARSRSRCCWKCLRGDPERLVRFDREAKVLASLCGRSVQRRYGGPGPPSVIASTNVSSFSSTEMPSPGLSFGHTFPFRKSKHSGLYGKGGRSCGQRNYPRV